VSRTTKAKAKKPSAQRGKRKASSVPTALDRDALFLGELAKGRSVQGACDVAGFGRTTVYERRANDAAFAASWDAAYEAGSDVLEDEMRRRALDGVEKGIYHQGVRIATERQYSDTMLIFALKARRPEKYRERFEVKNTDDTADLTDKQLQARILGVIGRDARLVEALIAALQSGAISAEQGEADAGPTQH